MPTDASNRDIGKQNELTKMNNKSTFIGDGFENPITVPFEKRLKIQFYLVKFKFFFFFLRKVDILIGFKKDHDFASPKYSIHKHRLVFILVSSFRLQISPLETSVRFL